MPTMTLRTTTCDTCGASQQHTTTHPAGWGRIHIYNFDHAGYAANTRVDKVICPSCADAAVEKVKG